MKPYIYLILGLVIIIVVLMGGCTQQMKQDIAESSITIEEESPPETIPLTSQSVGLSTLCSGEEECISFCEIYRGECEEYCQVNTENPLCQKIFSFDHGRDWGTQVAEEQIAEKQNTEDTQNKNCVGTGTVKFTSPPMKIEQIGFILPIGTMEPTSGHVTPIDHGYYIPPNWKPEDWNNPAKFIDIFAPADGLITDINTIGGRQGDYRLVIYHTCTFYTIYIHIRELSPKIAQVLENDRLSGKNIQVKAGEVIGRANRFDFSVHNTELILGGFIIPEHYETEPWKIHTDDMFAYFVEPLKTQLLEKNVRQKEPRSGKIDYDIDGKLVGNWFVENTGGYKGNSVVSNYWKTHLVFAYDGLDPSLIIVSIGDYEGEAKAFAVKGNSPDPATVSISSGLVKYELVAGEYLTEEGKVWDRLSFAKISKAYGYDKQLEGTTLVQMLEDRKIKFEAFPEKTASQVSGFTENAKIYER